MTARWERTLEGGRLVLRASKKDGGAVLATIKWQYYRTYQVGDYEWEAGAYSGSHWSKYGAQRAARKALREK